MGSLVVPILLDVESMQGAEELDCSLFQVSALRLSGMLPGVRGFHFGSGVEGILRFPGCTDPPKTLGRCSWVQPVISTVYKSL